MKFECKSLILATGGYTRVYAVSSSRIFENYGEGVTILNTAIDGYVRASENLPIRLNLRCNFNRIIRNYERHVESFYKKHKENQELIGRHPEHFKFEYFISCAFVLISVSIQNGYSKQISHVRV